MWNFVLFSKNSQNSWQASRPPLSEFSGSAPCFLEEVVLKDESIKLYHLRVSLHWPVSGFHIHVKKAEIRWSAILSEQIEISMRQDWNAGTRNSVKMGKVITSGPRIQPSLFARCQGIYRHNNWKNSLFIQNINLFVNPTANSASDDQIWTSIQLSSIGHLHGAYSF